MSIVQRLELELRPLVQQSDNLAVRIVTLFIGHVLNSYSLWYTRHNKPVPVHLQVQNETVT